LKNKRETKAISGCYLQTARCRASKQEAGLERYLPLTGRGRMRKDVPQEKKSGFRRGQGRRQNGLKRVREKELLRRKHTKKGEGERGAWEGESVL